MPDTHDESVNVYEAENAAEAHVVRGVLAEAGIEAFVDEPNAAFAGLPLSRPQVRVRAADADGAKAAIAELEPEEDVSEVAEEGAEDWSE